MNRKYLEDFEYIESIEFSESCFFRGYQPPHKVTFDGENCIFSIGEESALMPNHKSEFMQGLKACKIEGWKRSYFNTEALDGVQWELKITYGNKKRTRVYSGSNEYPSTYDKLTELMGYSHDEE